MQVSASKILDQVMSGIEQFLLPELTTQTARNFADLATRLLRYIRLREEIGRNVQHSRERAQQQIAAALGATADDLESQLRTLIGASTRGEKPSEPAAWLRPFSRLLEAERESICALDPEARQSIASAYAGGKLERETAARPTNAAKAFDVPTLEAYLKARDPRWRDAKVTSLAVLAGGFSKETLRFTAQGIGDDRALVIRRDLPSTATDTSVVHEFPILKMAFAAGVTVPEPLWLETDSSVVGKPFAVVRAVEGSTDVSGWSQQPPSRDRFAADLGAEVAKLHRISVPVDITRGMSAQQLIVKEIDRWHGLYLRRRQEPSPLLGAEYAWLQANVPTSGAAPVLVHADIGFHNLLTVEGRVTAVLDWEFAHFGDPQEDLNYIRPFIEPLGLWESFLQHYREHGGVESREQDARFWEVWRNCRNAAGCVGALQAFLTGQYANPDAALKLAVAGINFGPRYQIEAATIICR